MTSIALTRSGKRERIFAPSLGLSSALHGIAVTASFVFGGTAAPPLEATPPTPIVVVFAEPAPAAAPVAQPSAILPPRASPSPPRKASRRTAAVDSPSKAAVFQPIPSRAAGEPPGNESPDALSGISADISVQAEGMAQELAADRETAPLDSNPRPVYPVSARRQGRQGTVMVRVAVDAEGTVTRVDLASSSGTASLDAAALEAVRFWRFHPSVQGGRPAASQVTVPVSFRLHEMRRG